MKKLIFTSLGIVSISILFLTLTNKNNQSSIHHDTIKIKNNILEKDKQNIKKENFLTSNPSTNGSKEKKKIEKETRYLAYLNYRKEQHYLEEKKIIQYLTHQKKLKHIREGGVKSKLEAIKNKREMELKKRYISNQVSKQRAKQANFLRHNREIQKRREQMHSLRDRQLLQTKYRGEL